MSYLQPGATFSESADSNVGNALGGGSFTSVSRALGSLTLKRLWSNYDLGLDYVGGVGYYDLPGQGLKSLQQMDIDQKVSWKRGQLSVRDDFSYLPEGNFGGSYGSLGSQGIATLGDTSFGAFFGGSALGSLGLAPHMTNVSLADVSENLSPKSSLTAAGGYGFTHYYGNDLTSAGAFIGSSQASGAGGLQPRFDVPYPGCHGLWISSVRFFSPGNCISFACCPADVRTSDLGTDGFAAGSWAAVHEDRDCLHDT